MKIPYIPLMILAGVSVVCSSCVSTPSCSSYALPGTISPTSAWTNASYDANGFPIFGYSYGRPVYGYTPSGSAVTSLAALTALCYVPHWKPATWYRGTHRYPHGIHRVPAPPKFPNGHRPGVRPPMPHQGGMHPNFGHPGAPGPNHGVSTMPAPVGARVAPVPGVAPHVAPAPGMSGVRPVAPAGGTRNFSTMPAPAGSRVAPVPGATPHVAPAPGVGGVKPVAPAGGTRNFSTMPAPAGSRVAPVPGATPHVAPHGNAGGVSTMPGPASVPVIRQ